MEFLFYVVFAIAVSIGIISVLIMLGNKRDKMGFNEYKQRYGSLSDNYPGSYSNYNDYM